MKNKIDQAEKKQRLLIEKRSTEKRDVNEKFFDRWADHYDSFIFGRWMKYIQRRVLEEIKISLNTSVLDIGCGTGYVPIQLAKTIKKGKIVGMDLSGEMIKQALLKTKKIKNIMLKKADVERIPYHNETFDHVLTTEAFHHFPNSDIAIKEMKRVTKENGTIIIADINIFPHFITNLLFKIEPGFVHMYSREEMLWLAEKHGLKIIKQKQVGMFFLMTIMMKKDFRN